MNVFVLRTAATLFQIPQPSFPFWAFPFGMFLDFVALGDDDDDGG
jgi:hypothetical protein